MKTYRQAADAEGGFNQDLPGKAPPMAETQPALVDLNRMEQSGVHRASGGLRYMEEIFSGNNHEGY